MWMRLLRTALRLAVQRVVDELEHVLGHALVHVGRELDEARLEAVRARLPREIEAGRSGCSAAEAGPG
jgi:hypothetical protein